MRNLALTFALLLTMTGCSIIDNIETISDHTVKTTNPNSTNFNNYVNYVEGIDIDEENPKNRIEITALRDKRRKAAYDTLNAVRELRKYTVNDRSIEKQQLEDAYQKIIEAQKSVNEYLQSAIKHNSNKWKISADKSLKALHKARHYLDLKKYKNAESELKLALLYLVNDHNALWLWQNKGKHVFPDYLKWGDSAIGDNSNIVNNPDTLVFSGGGARGPAYAGVLKYLQVKDKLRNVKRFIGTSAGSIMCTFMSLGTYYENNNREPGSRHYWKIVYEIIEEANFIDFIDSPLLKEIIKAQNFKPVIGNLLSSAAIISESMDNQYALCDGTELLKYFKKSFKKLGFDPNITLGELYKKTGNHLVLVSASVSYRRTAYFDYKTAPDLPVVKAMRASMAIPYIFKPIKYNNDFFVDGGTTNNYPIEYFEYIATDTGKEPNILGFMLFPKKEMLRPKWIGVDNPLGYTNAIIPLVMINTGSTLYQKNIDRTVFIDCGKIDVMSFNMTKEQTRKLMQAGYDAIENYYSK